MEHPENADASGVPEAARAEGIPDAGHTGDPTPARAQGVPVTARGLAHTYRSAEGSLRVLHQLDLVVSSGGYASIRGPSGAGKSTLLSLLGGLEPPQEGDVLVGDVNLSGLAGDELAEYRRSTVGFVFQHFGLLESLSARENVELACTLAGVARPERRVRAQSLLAAVGLQDRSSHRPPQLSGGERQRVALARALANHPRLILADEPTGNLDEDSALRVIELLEQLRRERSSTLVLVTHNRSLADRAPLRLTLEGGKLVKPPAAPEWGQESRPGAPTEWPLP